ncbi:MAG: Flp pilus assembly complex ATPase component TadA, partial [Erysipelothrix sp.]|nr:Flp pilus assembly complex ATPase component TadA [Erysipelothrix sp.]
MSNGLITDEQLEEALGYQKVNKKRLGETLVELGFVSDREINETLAKKLDVEFIESPLYLVDDTVARLIPESMARKYKIVGLGLRSGSLTIATTDPLDFEAIEDVAMITGLNVKTVISFESEIEKTINRVYSTASENIAESIDEESLSRLSPKELEDAGMESRVDSAPIVKLVNSIISEAYNLNASDIHIEPEEFETRIRFRIDGDLLVYNTINKNLHNLVTTRIKLIAGMNIAEKRVPLDGSFKFKSEYVT